MARKDGTTPLHSAVESSNHGVVRALLARGASWNAKTIRNETVLHVVGRCRLPVSKPVLQARLVSALETTMW